MNSAPVKVYILNFWVEGVNLNSLQQYLHDSVDVIAYWNYIPLVYCIKSYLTAYELRLKLASFFPKGNFMLAEINVRNMDGSMAGPAWDWFYLEHHDKLRPPAPLTGLSGLAAFDIFGPAGVLSAPTAKRLKPPKKP